MNKLVIDIDGVLCNHASAICGRVNEEFNLTFSSNDVIEWDFNFAGRITFIEAVDQYYQEHSFIVNMKPFKSALNFVQRASELFDITIATTRKDYAHKATLDWVHTIFGNDYKIRFIKSKIDLQPDVLIDDNEDEILRVINTDTIGVLFLQPWNRNSQKAKFLLNSKNVFCSNDFNDIIQLI